VLRAQPSPTAGPVRSCESWLHSPARRPLTSIFLLALFVRLINVALLADRDAFFAEQDTFAYWTLGTALAKPESFWPTLSAMTDRMPLYPLLLAGIQHAFGDAPRAVALIQAAVDAATCALITALGALISPRVGLIAGILAALSPTLIVFSTQILTDSLFLFFFALLLLAGARFLLRPSAGLAIGAGLSGGLALVTRPVVAPLLGAAAPLVFAIALV
jgi:4-amino-4-deoxy-L-arabinose transferase-like glycosyltransferase